MRWKAFFFLNPSEIRQKEEKHQLKSKCSAPYVDELKPFEEDLINMVANVKFRLINSHFHNQLKKDIETINSFSNVIIPADKTRNFYQVKNQQYQKLLRENITKTYKRSDDSITIEINKELQDISTKLGIADKIKVMPKQQAYVTIKDHINPAKSNLGIVSKQILERINNQVRMASKLNIYIYITYMLCLVFVISGVYNRKLRYILQFRVLSLFSI